MQRCVPGNFLTLLWPEFRRIQGTENLATHRSLGRDEPRLWLATHGSSHAVWIATTKNLIQIRDNRLLEEARLEEDKVGDGIVYSTYYRRFLVFCSTLTGFMTVSGPKTSRTKATLSIVHIWLSCDLPWPSCTGIVNLWSGEWP